MFQKKYMEFGWIFKAKKKKLVRTRFADFFDVLRFDEEVKWKNDGEDNVVAYQHSLNLSGGFENHWVEASCVLLL